MNHTPPNADAFLKLGRDIAKHARAVLDLAERVQLVEGQAPLMVPLSAAEFKAIYENDREDGWCGHDVSGDALQAIFRRVANMRAAASAPAVQGQDEKTMRALIEDAVANHHSASGYIELCMTFYRYGTLANRAASAPDAKESQHELAQPEGESFYIKPHDLDQLRRHHNGFAAFLSVIPRVGWVPLRAALAAAPSQPAVLSSKALQDVQAERKRQVEVEGFSAERDDKYIDCELARAAATYSVCMHPEELKSRGIKVWPWSQEWWKFTTYRRSLVKAAALLIAEIERVDRAEAKHHESA